MRTIGLISSCASACIPDATETLPFVIIIAMVVVGSLVVRDMMLSMTTDNFRKDTFLVHFIVVVVYCWSLNTSIVGGIYIYTHIIHIYIYTNIYKTKHFKQNGL